MSRPARALWIEMDQRIHLRVSSPRRGPRGPCGLKSPPWSGLPGGCRRGPRGPCGLKSYTQTVSVPGAKSRPARALWIEIAKDGKMQEVAGCRGPRGPCGLKSKNRYKKYSSASRGPRGPCGLKYTHVENQHPDSLSRPARALWIEIVLEDAKVYVGWGRGPRGPCGLKLSGRLIYILHGTVEAREGLVD